MITLTTSGGFTQADTLRISHYFKSCKHAYLTLEFGDGGNRHIQGVVEYDTMHTSNITQRCKRIYTELGLEIAPHAIRVKKASHLNGALIYTSKELSEKGSLLILRGWESTWIDKLVKENVQDIPHKMLKKKGKRLTQQTAGALIHEYCLANNLQVTGTFDMCEIGYRMSSEGYLFGSLRLRGVYMDTMSLFKNGSAVRSAFESDLAFM